MLFRSDLALDQDTGETHSGQHTYNKKHDISNKDELDYNTSLVNNIIEVKGNFLDKVTTTPMLHISVQIMFSMIPVYKDKAQNIYNMNNGAYFPQTIPTKISSVKTSSFDNLNKSQIFKSLNSLFKANSVNTLSGKDLESLKIRQIGRAHV